MIDTLLRHDLIICDEVGFAPLDDTGAQLLFRSLVLPRGAPRRGPRVREWRESRRPRC